MKVEEYLAANGKNHFQKWFDSLPVEYAVKVAAARARMMARSLGNVKPLDGTLKEYRIDWGQGIRIYLIQDSERLIILLGGGTKSSQSGDIKRARRLRDEYFTRKASIKQRNKA